MAVDTAPFSALVFKVMSDPVVGSLSFGRIYSGTLAAGATVLNPLKGERERIGRMLQMQANAREDVRQAYAGDIVAFVGLKHTATGDTLCDVASPIVLERIEFPEPVIEIAVEPGSKADQEKLASALLRMGQEDPAFRVVADGDAGPTVIKGIGELQLEILVDRLKREFRVDAKFGAPRVAYRETIGQPVEVDYTHRKQVGSASQFARVKLALEPLGSGAGLKFENRLAPGVLSKDFVQAVSAGIESARETGAGRFPGYRPAGSPGGWRCPRHRQHGAGFRAGGCFGVSGRSGKGPPRPAGTDHERRSRYPRGLLG